VLVHDVIQEVYGINMFNNILDKLYAMYHASPKNAGQLQLSAASLEIEILKIRRILSTKRVASSYRTVLAVLQNYEALLLHFEKYKFEDSQSRKEQCTYG
jgi:hypothetical protein